MVLKTAWTAIEHLLAKIVQWSGEGRELLWKVNMLFLQYLAWKLQQLEVSQEMSVLDNFLSSEQAQKKSNLKPWVNILQ